MSQTTEEQREPGFYWVKLKPYAREGSLQVTPCDWEPMRYDADGEWNKTGTMRSFDAECVEEIGERINRHDAEGRKLLRSVMIELGDFHDPDFEDEEGNPMYGPFSEYDIRAKSGVSVSWGNMAYFEEEYGKLKEKEGLA